MHVLDWLDGGNFIPSINEMLRPTELFVPQSVGTAYRHQWRPAVVSDPLPPLHPSVTPSTYVLILRCCLSPTRKTGLPITRLKNPVWIGTECGDKILSGTGLATLTWAGGSTGV